MCLKLVLNGRLSLYSSVGDYPCSSSDQSGCLGLPSPTYPGGLGAVHFFRCSTREFLNFPTGSSIMFTIPEGRELSTFRPRMIILFCITICMTPFESYDVILQCSMPDMPTWIFFFLVWVWTYTFQDFPFVNFDIFLMSLALEISLSCVSRFEFWVLFDIFAPPWEVILTTNSILI